MWEWQHHFQSAQFNAAKQAYNPTRLHTMTKDDNQTEYLAVSSKHGWARHEQKSEAIQNALGHSCYLNEGDEVEITLYVCEPDTVMTNFGKIGVWIRDEDGEKADLDEEDIYEDTHTLRGSKPLIKKLEKTFKYEGQFNSVDQGFTELGAEKVEEKLHTEQ